MSRTQITVTDMKTPGEAADLSFVSDGSGGVILKLISGGGGGGGEVNTASNVGVGGIGLFYQKLSYDLQFKNINAGSNKVTVANDASNKEIDIDIAEANISHNNLSSLQGGTGGEYYHLTSTKHGNLHTPGTDVILDSGGSNEIAAFTIKTHIDDSTIHYTQATISITESQISDLDKYTQSGVDTLLAGKAATDQKLDDFGTPDNNTDLDATTGHHGLLFKLDGDITKYLRSDGIWYVPSGSGAGGGDMYKSTYDTDANDIVDKAEKLDDSGAGKSYTDISSEIDNDIATHTALPNTHHTQGTDVTLASGGGNEVAAADIRLLLNDTITGASNTFMGTETGYMYTNEYGNSFFGYRAGYAISGGGSNTFFGNDAGRYNTYGNYNLFMGSLAGGRNTIGISNISIGGTANYYNQEGSNNTIIGVNAGKGTSLHNKSGNIFIGYKAGFYETGDNKLYIANSDTSSPLIGGDFIASELYLNGKVGIGITPKTRLTIEGALTLKEQAAADSDTANYGQLWIKTATPCELWYTDDAGNDYRAASSHNDLSGLQGGTAAEYYHMTSTEHTAATRDATNSLNGLMPTAKLDNWDAAYTHVSNDGSDHSKVTANETAIALNTTHRSSVGTDHTYINQDLRTTFSPTFANLYVPNGGFVGVSAADGWTFDSTNGDISTTSNVGIGTNAPAHLLDIGGVSSLHAAGDILTVNSNAGTGVSILGANDAPTTRPGIIIMKSRGTLASPTTTVSGDKIGFFGFKGYDGSAMQLSALVEATVDGSVSSGAVPIKLTFVTGSNSSTRKDRLTVKADGKVGVGTINPGAILHAEDSSFPVGKFTRTSNLTTYITSSILAAAKTTGNMADGFGAGLAFSIQDATSAQEYVAYIAGIRSGADNSGALSIYTYNAGTSYERLRITEWGHFYPIGAGTSNFGDATNYWGDISYKTMTDRGCLGWYEGGVEMPDGTMVNDIEALKLIKKHPTLKTGNGIARLDYSSMPKDVYKPAKIAKKNIYDSGKLIHKKGTKMGDDGAEMSAFISIMFGAIKELSDEIDILKKKLANI